MNESLSIAPVLTRVLPKGAYNGLTLIVSKASRFDERNGRLITGTAGQWLHADVLMPEIKLFNCDIRTIECREPLYDNTRAVALLGEDALHLAYPNARLTDLRGSPLLYAGRPAVATFHPQDARDMTNIEFADDEAGEDDESAKKDRSRTSRSNYPFWVWADLQKLKRYGGYYKDPALNKAPAPPRDDIRIRPPSAEAIKALNGCQRYLFLDIETHPCGAVTVLGFACDDGPVYVVPLYDFGGFRHPDALKVLIAFSRASLRGVQVVAHNGATFDFPYLVHFGNIPLGKNLADTLIMQHRIYPEAEKSLAHCISLWTDAPFHKDEACYDPRTLATETQFLMYNAKDVARLREVFHAQWRFAEGDPGLQASMHQGNRSIYPLLLAGAVGIRVDTEAFKERVASSTARTEWIRKILRILVGYELNPASPQQKAEYLHGRMGYKVLARTETGAPSVGRLELIRLRMQHTDNPVLTVLLAYAKAAKEASTLQNIVLWNDQTKKDIINDPANAST